MAVEAGQLEVGAGRHPAGGLQGVPGADGEAELRVLGAGLDVLVGVGLDARRHPDHDPGDGQPALDQRLEPVELGERVGHDPPDAGGQGGGQLLVGLVVAVEHDAGRREAGREGDVELAAGRDVEVQSFFGDESHHGRAEERLAGVGDRVGAEGGDVLPAAGPEVRLVVDEQRRPEALGQLPEVAPADREPAGRREGGRAGRSRRSIGSASPGFDGRSTSGTGRVLVVARPRRRGAVHAVGDGSPEEAERVPQADPAGLRQPEPGLGELGVVGEHPAVSVEAVEARGELAHPGRHPVRGPQAGGLGDHVGVGGQRAQQVELPVAGQPAEVDPVEGTPVGTPRSAAMLAMETMRAWAYCT